MTITRDATLVWRYVNGLVCIYKPSDVKVSHLRQTIIGNLCRDLCSLEQRPPVHRYVLLHGADGSVQRRFQPSYADNVLAVGPRYQPQDIKCRVVTPLGDSTSGVLLLGINSKGTHMAYTLHHRKEMRVFHVSARLGLATDTGWADRGKATMKANFKHVPREAIDRVLAATQAAHQRQSFLFAGVHPQSQEAYEMASTGLLKPAPGINVPLLYGARCVEFTPPNLTMEIHSIGETEQYLLQLVGEVGRRVRSAAACTGIRCIRHGVFNVEHALARTQWSVNNIVKNMHLCKQLYEQQYIQQYLPEPQEEFTQQLT